jgi:RNA polymerase sigma-70 factor (ECF subfamily)
MVDDALLVTRARTGDADAYAALLTRHHARLLRVCVRALGENDGAADIAQEAALVAWLQLDRLRDRAHFGAWPTGIGRNLALRGARERCARQRWNTQDTAPPDQPSAEGDDPALRLLARERAAELAAAISELSTGQRDAVLAANSREDGVAEFEGRLTSVGFCVNGCTQRVDVRVSVAVGWSTGTGCERRRSRPTASRRPRSG